MGKKRRKRKKASKRRTTRRSTSRSAGLEYQQMPSPFEGMSEADAIEHIRAMGEEFNRKFEDSFRELQERILTIDPVLLLSSFAFYGLSTPAGTDRELTEENPILQHHVEAAGRDAHDFGGVNIVHVLTATWYSPTLGAFGVPTNTWHQAWAILGLAAAGEPVPVSATQRLLSLQQADGSWVDVWGWSKPDSTGLVLQALIAAALSPTQTSVLSGVAFLRTQQDALGGWGNANSTAYAIQGLLAVGEDLVANWATEDGHTPYDALAFYQKSDGPFVWAWSWPADSVMATGQAVPALLGVHYPLSPTLLTPFKSVYRGLDPDRTVACAPRATWDHSVRVVVPFGSDLNGDGTVTLDWRVSGGTWVTGTLLQRADGYYTATLPLTLPLTYEFRATFTDPDGVQYGPTMSAVLEPHYVYLPLVVRNG